MTVSRRSFLNSAPLIVVPALVAEFPSSRVQIPSSPVPELASSPGASFPSHPPDLAREIVGVSHNNLVRVKELLEDPMRLLLGV